MASQRGGPADKRPLGAADIVGRFAIIGGVLLCSAAAFAYTGGWLSPDRITPASLVKGFEQGGVNPGFRRNHAKGMCALGTFESNGAAASLSSAAILAAGRTPVVARFGFAGPMPFVADAPGLVRSLAIQFKPAAGGPEWRTGMINIPVFPFATVQEFVEGGQATKADPATGKPDPAKVAAFAATHPDFGPAGALIGKRAITSGFADTTFNSLHAFRFVAADGTASLVRWSAVPVDPVQPAAGAPPTDPNGLYGALIARAAREPVRWRLVLTVGAPDDPISPAKVWPEGRRTVEAGTVVIDRLQSEDGGGACQDVNYDPLVLPPGIESSGDETLSARSAAYSRSFRLREGEQGEKKPSAVTPAIVGAAAKQGS